MVWGQIRCVNIAFQYLNSLKRKKSQLIETYHFAKGKKKSILKNVNLKRVQKQPEKRNLLP